MIGTTNGLRWTKIVLLATTALAFSGGVALARVGVTSATAGDPLGKPPTEAERVLRIGIDIQANELITTNASDRAHLVFIDGTSITVGPNAQLTIDRFVFDPNTKTGDLALTASKGVLRVVGGRISKSTPITVTTPANTVGIRGSAMQLKVEPTSTTADFITGAEMTVKAQGVKVSATRQGSRIETRLGFAPGQPTIIPRGGYVAELRQLEGTSSSGSGTGSGGTTRLGADQVAQSSGFSVQNSGQPAPAGQPQQGAVAVTGSPAQAVMNANIVSNALSNAAADQQQQQALADRPRLAGTTSSGSPSTPGVTPTPTPTPPTNPSGPVIVTRGRFTQDPSYTNFNNQTLQVTPVAANRQALAPTGTLVGGIATVTLADGRTLSVPWKPGTSSYAVTIEDPTLGRLTGTGYVNQAGDFFVFAFKDANNQTLGFAGGTPTSLAQFPTSGFAAHTLTNISTGGGMPFASPTVAGNALLKAAATISPLYSVYSPNANPVVGGPALSSQSAGALQATVAIAGTGANQISYVGVFIGDYFKDFNVNSTFNSGVYLGTYRLNADQSIGRLGSAESTVDTGSSPGSAHSIYGPNAESMVYGQTSYRSSVTTSAGVITSGTTSISPQAGIDQPFNNPSGSDYTSRTVAIKTTSGPELNATRTTGTMTGYVGGVVESSNSSGTVTSTRTIGVTGASPAQVALVTDAAANRVFATITVSQWNGAGTSATYNLGGTSGARLATQTYINDQIYALRDRPAADFTTQIASVTSGSTTSTGTAVSANTSMVSYGAARVDNFFAGQGVTPCTCEFMSWGWWSGDTRYGNNSVYNPNGRDRMNLATYVVGNVTPSVQMPNTGSATFAGHAVGNVVNGSSSYLAAGTFNGTWNFAARNGTIAIGNFDGVNYSGSASQLTGSTVSASQFNGSLAGGGRTGSVTGSFFNAGSAPAQGMGGSFAINGPNYKAGGTFAGQRQ